MSTTLYYHVLDEGLFPELERAPGVYAIELTLLQGGTDKRVAAPKTSPAVLLVSYTLLAAAVPHGSAKRLAVAGPRPDGKPRQTEFALIEPAPQEDNVQPITPDPSIRLAPGTLDRSVFWVDLAPLLRDGILMPGDTLTLRYGSASAQIVLPAARGAR